MKKEHGLSQEELGFKTGYGSKEPSAKEESEHIRRMQGTVSQKPDSIGPMGGNTAIKTSYPKHPSNKY